MRGPRSVAAGVVEVGVVLLLAGCPWIAPRDHFDDDGAIRFAAGDPDEATAGTSSSTTALDTASAADSTATTGEDSGRAGGSGGSTGSTADPCVPEDRTFVVTGVPDTLSSSVCPGGIDRWDIDLGLQSVGYEVVAPDCAGGPLYIELVRDGNVIISGPTCGPVSYGASGDPVTITVQTQLTELTAYAIALDGT